MRALREHAQRLKQELALCRLLLQHPRTPWPARALLWLAVGYVLLPFDLIPDFIPVLGQLDELVIVPALVGLAWCCIPPALVAECRQQLHLGQP